MPLRFTQTDGSSTLTVTRQRVRKAVAGLFAGALLASGAAAAAPADEAAAFKGFLERTIWASAEASPALAGAPKARVLTEVTARGSLDA